MIDFTQTLVIDTDETVYSDVFSIADDKKDFNHVEFTTLISSYVAGNVVITPQVSLDKVNWQDLHPLDALSADGLKAFAIANPSYYIRFKIVSASSADLTLQINAVTAKGLPKINGFGEGVATVATAGTAVPLSATSKLVRNISIQSASGNTGSIYQGGSGIGNGASEGVELVPLSSRDPLKLAYADLADIYINADNDSDKAIFAYEY